MNSLYYWAHTGGGADEPNPQAGSISSLRRMWIHVVAPYRVSMHNAGLFNRLLAAPLFGRLSLWRARVPQLIGNASGTYRAVDPAVSHGPAIGTVGQTDTAPVSTALE
jgi:hypothetical protein